MTDDEIEALAKKHIAPHADRLDAIMKNPVPYQQTEQFRRVKALIADVLSKLRAPVADERAAFSRAEISFPLTIPETRVYLAGPMTGHENHNFPAFHAAAERLRGSGLEVVNPADHGLVSGLGWSDYMRWDLVKLAGCHAVYVLPGWEKSKGASLEISIARALGMPVFTVDGAALASAPVADAAPEYTYSDDGKTVTMTNRDRAPGYQTSAPVAGEAKSPDRAMLEAVMNDLNVSDWNCPRCGHAEECSTMDAALMLRDYLAAPQASEAVCKEDVATVLHFIFEHFGKPFNACDLPGYVVAAVRRLEHAALSAQPDAEPLSNPKQFALTGTENIRAGAPYDDPAFEALCREHGIWGTAEAALCAVFWRQAGQRRAAVDERTAFEATYQADYDDPGAACEREHFGKGYRAALAAQSGAQRTGGSDE